MKIKKLNEKASWNTLQDVVYKINEIIDILNKYDDASPEVAHDNSAPETKLVPNLDNVTPDKVTYPYLTAMLNDMSSIEVKNELTNRVCPHCGKNHYTVGPSCVTAVHYPEIYKDGKLVTSGHNVSKTTYHCCECGKYWTEET